MKKFTCFFYLIFFSCTSTGFASDRPGIGPGGDNVEPVSSEHEAPEMTFKEGKKETQEQNKDIIIVTPGDNLEVQELRESKEIHLRLENREFMGIEPHHVNERDYTIIRQRPDIVK
jgi:zona occludens toxin (predicted ATPase)